MRTSDQINEIATALAKAQGAIEGAKKGNINPHFKSRYADLGAVWDACREALSANGIAVVQPVSGDKLYTNLMHASGQWIEDDGLPLLIAKQDMQGLGSALTYARRYGLMAMVGIAPEDDDANAAVQSANAAPETPRLVEPKGYADWLTDLAAVADEGSDALKKAWSGSRPELRAYLTKVAPAAWEGLKARAQKVGAA